MALIMPQSMIIHYSVFSDTLAKVWYKICLPNVPSFDQDDFWEMSKIVLTGRISSDKLEKPDFTLNTAI
jgi:hypothetical protein